MKKKARPVHGRAFKLRAEFSPLEENRMPNEQTVQSGKLLATTKRASYAAGAVRSVTIASRVFVRWNSASARGVRRQTNGRSGDVVDEILSKIPNVLDSLNTLSKSTSNAIVYRSLLPKRYR